MSTKSEFPFHHYQSHRISRVALPQAILRVICLKDGKELFLQVSVYPYLGEGGAPSPFHKGLGYPSPSQDRTSPKDFPSHKRLNTRESTWFAAGGMPLAFTQEDFLVIPRFHLGICVYFYILFPLKEIRT